MDAYCARLVAEARCHLATAGMLMGETTLKLARECRAEKCDLKPETRIEGEEAVKHLLAAEEDLAELAGLVAPDRAPEVFDLVDAVRRARQGLVRTRVPLRGDLAVDWDGAYAFTRERGEVERIAGRLEAQMPEIGECTWCELDASSASPDAPAAKL